MKTSPRFIKRTAAARRYCILSLVTIGSWSLSNNRHAAAFEPPTSTPVRTVAFTGQPAPGTPDGVTFSAFNEFYFSLNDVGQAAFLGQLQGPGVGGLDRGIWSEGFGSLALVARNGAEPPDLPIGSSYNDMGFTVLNAPGQVAFQSGYTNGGTLTGGQGIWSQRLGLLSLVAGNETQTPGAPVGVHFAGFGGLVLNDSGRTAFKADLAGDGVDLTNDEGIWSEGPGPLTLMARQGDLPPGMPPGMTYDVLGSPRINDNGHIAFYGFVGGNGGFGQGVWSQGSTGLSLVAASGGQTPGAPTGTSFAGFSDPAFNNSGHMAFWAYLEGPGPLDPYDDGIWVEGVGGLELAARRGDAAPGMPSGVKFGSPQIITFDSPVLSDSGKIAFRGFISGPGVDESNDEGIWSGEAGNLSPVARAGSHAPGTPAGVTFESFFPWNGALQMNAVGQCVFTAFLRDGDFGAGIGIWATDVAGTLRKIVGTGDSLEIAPGDIRTVIDLSFINDPSGGSDGRSSGINNRGQIAFWAKFVGGDEGIFVSNVVVVPEPASLALAAFVAIALATGRHRWTTALLSIFCVIAVAAPAHALTYTITDLGALGGTDSLPWAINNQGQVAGYAATTDDLSIEGFLWTPTTPNAPTGSMLGLESLHGTGSWGTSINAGGQVAGVSFEGDDEGENEHATLWNPTTPNGTTGALDDLGTLGGTYSEAHGINDLGQVSGAADITGDAATHAFMWKPTTPGGTTGTMFDLGSLGGSFAIGWDVNASGAVAGGSDITDDATAHAFLWKPTTTNGTSGTMHDLGTLGGTFSEAYGINDSGQVTGTSQTSDDEAYRAFLWTPTSPGGIAGAMQDLGTLGGLNSYGIGVSAAGHVVGASEVPVDVSNYSHAFLYTTVGGMVDLNALIDPLSGWELLDADGINDAGQITGQGLIGEEYHAFLLTPVAALPGDFNLDDSVDGADLELWKTGFGVDGNASLLQGDADGDRDVDGADFLTWQRGLGAGGVTVVATAAVPEPAAIFQVCLGLLAIVILGSKVAETALSSRSPS